MSTHYLIVLDEDTPCADCGTIQVDTAEWIGTDPQFPDPVGRVCCTACADKVRPRPTVTVKQLREILAGYPADFEVCIASVVEGMAHVDSVSPRVTINGPAVQLNTTAFVEECL